jgi:thiol-disulfide isomerase/thioredoxin
MARRDTDKENPPSGRLLLPAAGIVLAAAAALVGLWPSDAGREGVREPAGDVQVVARGDEVVLADHLVAGKFTVIDFYADWCPNCRRLNPILEEIAGRTPALAIRKINVLSWDSPVARQHQVTALPRLLLYGPQGDLIAEGEAVLPALRRISS